MRYLCLFSGIGSFALGMQRAGWTATRLCEFDPQARQVLNTRFGGVPITPDVRDLDGSTVTADAVVFGSPCQGLSQAGRGAGLNDNRSGLFYEAVRVIKEMQHAAAGTVRPRFLIWENVPGALHTNGGEDFAAVLREFQQLGAVDIAWRVLDSRHFGVAQQRRRLFVAVDLRGERAHDILFDRPGRRRHVAPGGNARTADPAGTAPGAAASDLGTQKLARTLTTRQSRNDTSSDTFVLQMGQDGRGVRHLTPLECERLQGLPDGWTDVGISDTARYRMLGNAGTVPLLQWIGEGMREAMA